MPLNARTPVLILAAALTGGCGEPVPVALTSLGAGMDDDEELVDEAFAILGLPWEPTKRTRGTVHLTLVGEAGLPLEDKQGKTVLRTFRCIKSVVATRHARAIAHELGHALGLDHSCEEPCPDELADNLMAGVFSLGSDLNDEQYDELERGRRRLTSCR
ncbi:MAG: reprolysin-like metallopeptidase [Myxococcota bacterium]